MDEHGVKISYQSIGQDNEKGHHKLDPELDRLIISPFLAVLSLIGRVNILKSSFEVFSSLLMQVLTVTSKVSHHLILGFS